MVTLQNVSRRQVVILLDHASFRDDAAGKHGFKAIRRTTVAHSRKGELQASTRPLSVPHAVTILAGHRATLPDDAVECRDVKRLLGKELRITAQDVKAEEAAASPPPPAPTPPAPGFDDQPAPTPPVSVGDRPAGNKKKAQE